MKFVRDFCKACCGKRVVCLLTLVCLLAMSASAFGHSGRTDKSGCHTNRKTGQRH